MKNRAFRKFVASIGVAAMVMSTATNALSPAVTKAESAQELEGQQNGSQEQGGQEDPVAQSSDDVNGAPFADAEPMAVSSDDSQNSQEAAGPSESSDSNGENGAEGSSGENTNASAGSTSTDASGAESQGAAGTINGATNGAAGTTNSTIPGTTGNAGTMSGATNGTSANGISANTSTDAANGTSTDASTGMTTGENGEASGDNAEASTKEITSVITEDIDLGTYPAGEAPAYAQLELPDEIEVKVDEEKQIVTVTWNGEETYHPDQAGTYIFSSELDKEWNKDENGNARYQLAEKVELPKASVRVEKKAESKEENKTDVKSDNKTENKTDAKLDNKTDSKTDAKADNKKDSKTDAKADNKSEGKTEEKSDSKSEVTTKPETAKDTSKETTKDTPKETSKETSKKDSTSKDKTKDETKGETKDKTKDETKAETKTDTKDESAKADQKKKVTNAASLKAVYVAEDGTILCGTVGLTGDSFTISDKAKSFNGYELKTVTLGEEELPQDTAFTRNTSTTETKEEIRTEASYTYTMDGAEHEIAAGDTATITFTYAQKEEVTPEIASIEVTGEAVDTTGAAIQGDYAFPLAVGTNDLSKTAPYIQGYEYQYAEIGTDKITSIAKEVLEAGKYAYYVDGELLKENTRITYVYQEDEDYTKQLTGTCGNLTVTVSAKKDAKIPEGTIVRVSPIESARMSQIMAKISETLGQDPDNVIGVLYDISLDKDGEEIQPKESVHVTMQFAGGIPWNVPEGKQIADTKVVHMHGGETDVVAEAAEDGKAEFETASFSPYGMMALYAEGEQQDVGVDLRECLTGVTVSKNGTTVDQNTQIGLNDTLQFSLSYELPAGTLQKSTSLTYQLPNNFNLAGKDDSGLRGTVFNSHHQEIGTYVIDKNTGLITITIVDQKTISSNLQSLATGNVGFECSASQASSDKGGKTQIDWNDTISSMLTIEEKKYNTNDLEVEKSQSVLDQSQGKIEYQIKVKSANGTKEQVVLKDIMSATNGVDFKYLENFTVKNKNGEDVTSDFQTVPGSGATNFDITIPKLDGGDEYTITYIAKLGKENYTSTVTNKVTATSRDKDGKKLEANAEVTYDFKQDLITKSGEKQEDGKVKWTVVINSGKINLNGWTIKDIFNGKAYEGLVSINPSVNGASQISLPYKFATDTTGNTYTITYFTNEKIVGQQNVVNKAILEKGNESRDTGDISVDTGKVEGSLSKEGTGLVDHNDGAVTLNWKVTINSENGTLKANWYFNDYFQDQSQTYTDSEKQAIDAAWKEKFGEKNYKITWNQNGYMVEVYCDFSGTFTYTYSSDGTIINKDASQSFINKANINNTLQSQGENKYEPDHPLVKKLDGNQMTTADTSYDSTDSKINANGVITLKWKVEVCVPEETKNTIGDITVTDTIPDGMTLTKAQIGDPYWIDFTNGGEFRDEIQASIDGKNINLVLPAEFVKGLESGKVLQIWYEAKINNDNAWSEGQVKTEKNTVSVSDTNNVINETTTQTQNVTLKKKDDEKESLVKKEVTNAKNDATFDGNNIKYSVTVNPSGKKLGDSETISCVDQLSYVRADWNGYEVSLVPQSVNVIDLDTGKSVTDFSYKTGEDKSTLKNGDEEHHKYIYFILPNAKRLKIDYVYHFSGNIGTNRTLVNEFSVQATTEGNTTDKKETYTVVSKSQADLNATGINFYKVDKDNEKNYLRGGKFTLEKYDKDKKEWATVSENLTANDEGLIETENLIKYNVAYRLIETTAPDGYEAGELGTDGYSFIMYHSDKTTYPESKPDGFAGEVCDNGELVYLKNEKTETVEISGEKTWDMQGYSVSKPGSITVKVKDGDTIVDTIKVTPNEKGEWKYTSKKLPKYRADGKTEIKYTVDEDVPSGYEKSVTRYNIKNTYKPDTKTVSGEKKWDLKGNTGIELPEYITVKVKDGDTVVDTIKVTPNEKGEWKYTSKELPKYRADGKTEITYTVDEDVPAGYTKNVEGTTITNTLETVEISGEKTWDMQGYSVSKPGSITVKVKDGDTIVDTIKVTPNEKGEWKYTSKKLPKYRADGKTEIKYTVDEDVPSGYEKSVTRYNIKNTYKPDTKTVSGEKKWDLKGNTGIELPEYITVKVKDGDTVVDTIKVTPNEKGEWKYTSKELPKYRADGKTEITYTVDEDVPAGYTKNVEGTTITNTLETVEISGEKTWDMQGYSVSKPGSITVKVKDGDTIVDTITVTPNEKGEWKYTSKKLPKYRADGKTEIKYTVDEDVPSGYEKSVTRYNIKNTYKPDTKTVSGEKKWDLKGNTGIELPEYITVKVKDGDTVVDTIKVTPNEKGEWKYTSKELPKYRADGKTEITYTVDEDVPAGYTKNVEGTTITNTLETVEISGEKTWDMQGYSVSKPGSITVKVKDGDTIVDTIKVTPNEKGEWKYTSKKLPKYRADGKTEIKYTVDEDVPSGYEKSVTRYNIKNTYKPDTKTVSGEKKWDLKGNTGIELPEYITVKVKDGDTVVDTIKVTPNEKGEWKYTSKELPKYRADGKTEITYTVDEDVPAGYTKNVEGTTITNTLETVEISGEKTWDMQGYSVSKPGSITVKVKDGDTIVDTIKVTPNEKGEWKYTSKKLPKYRADGKTEIKYTVDEDVPSGYEKSVTRYNIKNTYKPDTKTVSGEKKWDLKGNTGIELPEYITVKVKDGDTVVDTIKVTPNEKGEWKYTSKELPKYRADGKTEITYTVDEDVPAGYTKNVEGTTITNALETVEISGEKTWDMQGYSVSKPGSITVKVKDGDTIVDTIKVTPNEKGEWKYTSKKLPKYRADGKTEIKYTVDEDVPSGYEKSVTRYNIKNTYKPDTKTVSGEKKWDLKGNTGIELPEYITVKVKDGDTVVDTIKVTPNEKGEWKYTSKELPKYRADGKTEITYTVDEDVPAGYTKNVEGTTITNTLETVEISGEKTWDMQGYSVSKPGSITVKVKDGDTIVDTIKVTPNEKGEWKYTSKKLPKYRADGKTEIKYTVDEDVPSGYEKSVTRYNIKNTYKPDTKTVSGEKKWDLKGNTGIELPEYITVKVKDGDTVVDTIKVTPNEKGEWKYTSKELPKYRADGKTEITYTVDEDVPAGYTKNVEGTTITNTLETVEISGEKTWDMQGYSVSKPGSITVKVKDGDTIVDTITVTPNEKGEWKYTSKKLPKYRADGKTEIKYTVDEDVPSGYEKSVTRYNIKNTYKPDTKTVSGEKKWDLKGNTGIELPEYITVKVKDGDTVVDTIKVTPNEKGEWKYTSKELPKYRADGKTEITYTVDEDVPAGYTKNVEGTTITNTLETVEISGEKTWDMQGYSVSKPGSITVKVKDGDTIVDTIKVTPNEKGEWKYTSKKLPKYRADGKTEIKYTVDEDVPSGYEKSVTRYNIKNTYKPDTKTVSGEKKWDLKGNTGIELPEYITVKVKDGDTVVDTIKVTPNEKGEWKYTSKELPKYRADGKTEITYTVDEDVPAGYTKNVEGTTITNTLETVEISGEKTWDMQGYSVSKPGSITVKVKDGDTIVDTIKVTPNEKGEWKYTSKKLPKYRADGKTEIKYTVDEDVPSGYEKSVTRYNIKNTYKPDTKTVSGEKKWDLKGNTGIELPEYITVKVKDGDTVVDTIKVTPNEKGEWKYTSKELPKYRADGKTEITYTVDEDVPAGYTKNVEGTTITNALETVEISGEKTWDMQGYSVSKPGSITVKVKDGDTIVDTIKVTPNEKGEWKYTSKKLPKYRADGKTEIKYTVDEDVPSGYEKSVTRYNIKNTYKPDTKTVSGEKKWDLKGNTGIELPEYITVKVKDGDTVVDTIKVTPNEKGEWKYTSKELPKYRADGKTEITYTVDEDVPAGYTKNVEGTTITNTLETVEISGEKTWDMQGYSVSKPGSITVKVKDGDTIVDTITVTPNEKGEWKYTSKKLPKYRADGKTEIKYTVDEDVPSGYEKSVTRYNIKNTYKPDTKTVSGEKKWDLKGNTGIELPEYITVKVKDGDTVVDTIKVTPNEKGEWKYTSKELPKYRADGKTEITYTVDEDVPAGYTKNVEGTTITNTLETVEISGEKTWDMQGYSVSKPGSITVKVKDGDTIVDTIKVTPNEKGEWKYTSKKLPKYRADGKTEIKYTVDEDVPSGYEKSVTRYNIKNTYKPDTKTVSGEKKWDLKGNTGIELPEYITVKVKDGDTVVDTIKVTPNEKGEWKYTSKELPKYRADGKTEITYTVDEDVPAGYTKNVEGTTITNTLETVEISGEKTWDMQGYSVSKPGSITVKVKDGDTIVDTIKVTPNEKGEWKYTSKKLPKYRADGKTEIKYTVDEDVPSGYEKSVTRYNIKNTYKPDTKTVSGEKKWDLKGNTGIELPEYITVKVKDGDTVVDTIKVTPNEKGEWKYTSKELPKYRADGKTEITYTVDEDVPAGYTKNVEGTTITNTLETVEISGEKTWDMQGYSVSKPGSITVKVKDGDTIVDTIKVTPNEKGEWKYTSKKLPKYRADGKTEIKYTVDEDVPSGYEKSVTRYNIKNTYKPDTKTVSGEKKWDLKGNTGIELPEYITVKVKDGDTVVDTIKVTPNEKGEWKYTSKELPKYRADGKTEITYTVDEDVPAGYTKNVEGTTITNTLETTSICVSKTWSDDSNRDNKRPASITVNLFADGTKVASQKITEANGWKYEFKDLPKYEDGKEIKYTITEDAVEGYTSTVEGFNITNTYTPEKVQVSGSKNWNDDGNAAGTRPGSITIRLYANGSEIDHKTVTEKDGWSWNWTGLNRYDTDHKEISYTISEDAVDGYTSSISGYNVTNTVNKPQVGSVILTKVDATTGTALAGAVFDLYRANNTKVGTYTTNAGGVLRVDGLTFGDYYFVETKAPEGYALESQRAAFTINAATTVSAPASVRVTNKPVDEKIGVSAAKVWDDENNTDGVRPSSVTFRLFADGVEIGSAQASEANGWTVSFGNLPKTRNGAAISYAVKEDEVGNYYEASYETGLGSDGSYVFTVKNYRETDKHYEERTGSVRGANRNKPSNGGVAGAGRGRGTGDESDMTVYGTVSGASLLALIVWMIARRKRAGKGTK